MRPLYATGLAAVAAAAWAANGVASQTEQPASADPPGLTLSRAGLTANASLGSFCAAGMCLDRAQPPEPAGRLPVRRRATVVLRLTLPADFLAVRLGRSGGRRLEVERETARRWRVRLPRKLGGADVISVFARGKDWDAAFWGGIRTGCG